MSFACFRMATRRSTSLPKRTKWTLGPHCWSTAPTPTRWRGKASAPFTWQRRRAAWTWCHCCWPRTPTSMCAIRYGRKTNESFHTDFQHPVCWGLFWSPSTTNVFVCWHVFVCVLSVYTERTYTTPPSSSGRQGQRCRSPSQPRGRRQPSNKGKAFSNTHAQL